MLQIFRNEKKKTTTAVIESAAFDAVKHIEKRLNIRDGACNCAAAILEFDKAIMSDKYTGTVTCDFRDVYNEVVGEDEAVLKAMRNHHKGYEKALVNWQVAMLKKIKTVSPETFEKAFEKIK